MDGVAAGKVDCVVPSKSTCILRINRAVATTTIHQRTNSHTCHTILVFDAVPVCSLTFLALFSSGHSPLHIDKHATGLTIAYLRSAIRMHVCRSRKRENQALSENSAVLLYLRAIPYSVLFVPPLNGHDSHVSSLYCARSGGGYYVAAPAWKEIMWQLLHGRKCNEC